MLPKSTLSSLPWALLFAAASLSGRAEARIWTVGPSGRDATQLSTLFNNNDLAPGDVV